MLTPEQRDFLLEQARTAKIATVRVDGRPHIAPVWFDLDGENIIFTTWHATVKASNIRRDQRIAICVDDERPPFAFLVIEGTAEITNITGDALIPYATRIAGRYMGADKAETYGKRNGVEGEHLVRVTPTRIIWQKDVAN